MGCFGTAEQHTAFEEAIGLCGCRRTVFGDPVHDVVRGQLRRVLATGRTDNFHKGCHSVLVEVINPIGFIGDNKAAL